MPERGQDREGHKFPGAFTEEMEGLFKDLPGVSLSELPAFLACLQGERSYGLRRNPLKYTKEKFEADMPFSLEKIPWATEGYFYKPEEQPGKSPYHEMGAYYIQEPSAMIAAELLDARPGEMIADLCAAPGGKSTQIAGKMQGKGLLVCNEYVAGRAGILAQNMERMGIRNCVILNEDTRKMAEHFSLFFDRVLVDAPCSGEGMFRKGEEALANWSPENVTMCGVRQREILENASAMVKPGGVLVYSTCTFSEQENEDVIRDFLERHPEFLPDQAVPTAEQMACGICPGGLPGTLRMWPHKIQGEGHFAARLIKSGGETISEKRAGKKNQVKKEGTGQEKENRKLFQEFCEQYIQSGYMEELEKMGVLVWKNNSLFCIPAIDLSGLKTERIGLYLGEAKKGRYEPSHTWAMTLKKEDVKQWWETKDPGAYLRGETQMQDIALQESESRDIVPQKGWTLVLWHGKALGWGKASGSVIKNHYPRGLRKGF